LYGPGWINSSISGFRLELNAVVFLIPALSSAPASRTVPSGKGWLMARGWRYDALLEKSSQRGIVTEQSQSLYAEAQSSQVRVSE
jgi:hypothetical protein